LDLTKNKGASGARRFHAPNPFMEVVQESDRSGLAPPGATIYYFVKSRSDSPARITILDSQETVVRGLTGPAEAGINRLTWDLRGDPRPPPPPWRRVGGNDSRRLARGRGGQRPGRLVPPGQYHVELQIGTVKLRRPLRVNADETPAPGRH
jgi:hypothetical protein